MNAATLFLQHLLNGVAAGTLYALVAVGLTMTYGILHVTNFAHGEFMTVGAIACWFADRALGLPFALAALAGAAAAGLLGLAVERMVFRPTLRRPMTALVVSLGLIIVLQNGLALLAGTQPLHLDPPLSGVTTMAGGVRIADQRLAALAAGVGAIALVGGLLHFTALGRSLRAIAVDPKAAQLVGLRPGPLYAAAFAIGCALAGWAGAMLCTLVPVDPFMGAAWVAKAFVVIVLGGLGSFAGAIVGGLLLGIAESLGAGYISSTFTDAFGFVTLIALLLWRPNGLFGIVERRA